MQDLELILEKHILYLKGKPEGELADLRGADLRGADLRGADLRGADLGGADLWGANLGGAIGNMKEIKSMTIDQHPITYTFNVLQIGCERHLISEWKDFEDKTILGMDGKRGLKLWKKYKDLIFNTIELSPALDPQRV